MAATILRAALGPPPELAIVLGSGLAAFADALEQPRRINQSDLDPRLRPSVIGHPGQVVGGTLGGRRVWAWVGRVHAYEGAPPAIVTLSVQALGAAGVPRVLLTNAAGGLRPEHRGGDLVLITDHINLPGLTGNNPLIGLPDPPGGSRFIDLGAAYDLEVSAGLRNAARRRNLVLREGVYCYVTGPAYETPAERSLLRHLGADLAGMSTVPEVLMARRGGRPVAALACVANSDEDDVQHSGVLRVVEQAVPRVVQLIEDYLQHLD